MDYRETLRLTWVSHLQDRHRVSPSSREMAEIIEHVDSLIIGLTEREARELL